MPQPQPAPNASRPLDRDEIRRLQGEHAFALELVAEHAANLRAEIQQALLNADQAFTSGRLSQSAGALEAARQRAFCARDVLDRLGIPPNPSAGA